MPGSLVSKHESCQSIGPRHWQINGLDRLTVMSPFEIRPVVPIRKPRLLNLYNLCPFWSLSMRSKFLKENKKIRIYEGRHAPLFCKGPVKVGAGPRFAPRGIVPDLFAKSEFEAPPEFMLRAAMRRPQPNCERDPTRRGPSRRHPFGQRRRFWRLPGARPKRRGRSQGGARSGNSPRHPPPSG